MLNRPEYYKQLADINVSQAFNEVRLEILATQESLKKSLPKDQDNQLLHLVIIFGNRNLSVAKDFSEKILERIPVQTSTISLYEGLGHYVNILYEEIEKYTKK